ncbi:hypothetical protein CEP54_013228 [Fusarium duplospermum]|uniref:Arrestin C-terminal-like domain-containing protein n=1 Tax=Fusarium duplospermum TaxID=1325734 RepID=A0A428P433_9HYPO|nr:hypothetical protein CEP54_013228 [Fusarium duplospermum]
MPEARITYTLKATRSRPRLLRDVYTRKHLRIFRTPSPDALEMMQSVPIERTWLNKIDYFLNLSTGVVMLGGSVILEMRLSSSRTLFHPREHRAGRTISTWDFQVSRDYNQQDLLEGTDQQVWAITKKLNIPNRLCDCIQDLNVHCIRVYHKVRVVIPLRNADGHISELAMGLPLVITINPNMHFDGQSSASNPLALRSCVEAATANPPGYGEHILDQIFDEVAHEEARSTGSPSADNIQPPAYDAVARSSRQDQVD